MRLFSVQDDISAMAADFSPCGKYRYTLERGWNDDLPKVAFVGLNPSTATGTMDDPTIRRCVNFARDWGYGSMTMINLFAFRATSPKDMKSEYDPIGCMNNEFICSVAGTSQKIVIAWGNHGNHAGRDQQVLKLLENGSLHCFGITKAGQPVHPLYQRNDAKLHNWRELSND